jgi:OHCU decarboxylase
MEDWVKECNGMSKSEFVGRFGFLFEKSTWVAERAWEKLPFSGRGDFLSKMAEVVLCASDEEQLMLLNAHPELGAPIPMTEASVKEQSGAGLDRLARDEAYIFSELNRKYREKYGFPFIKAVRGLTADMIADSMQLRMQSRVEEEKRKALEEVFKIALFRLQHLEMDRAVVGGGNG